MTSSNPKIKTRFNGSIIAALPCAFFLSVGAGFSLGKASSQAASPWDGPDMAIESEFLRAPGLAQPKPSKDTLVQTLNQSWDTSGWHDTNRQKYYYEAATSRLGQEITQIKADSTWNTDSMLTFKYTAAGLNNEIQSSRWICGSEWKPSNLIKLSHNAAGKVSEKLYQGYWLDTWHNLAREVTTHSSTGSIKEVLSVTWENNAWVNTTRTSRVSGGDSMTETKEVWQDSVWVPSVRQVYTYGSHDYLTTKLEQHWDASDNSWVNAVLRTYEILPTGIYVQFLTQNWKDTAWVNRQLSLYTYEGTRLKQFLAQRWINGAWVNGIRNVHSYGTMESVGLAHSYAGSGTALRLISTGSSQALFRLMLPEAKAFRAEIFNLQGKPMGIPLVTRLSSGNSTLAWNGVDRAGATSAPGPYFLMIDFTGSRLSLPFVLAR
jgi:hypothetical protein